MIKKARMNFGFIRAFLCLYATGGGVFKKKNTDMPIKMIPNTP